MCGRGARPLRRCTAVRAVKYSVEMGQRNTLLTHLPYGPKLNNKLILLFIHTPHDPRNQAAVSGAG